MTSTCSELKNAAGTGYYARRILAQLAFLQNMLETETCAIPSDVQVAMDTLLKQVREEGAATKAAVLAREAALSHYNSNQAKAIDENLSPDKIKVVETEPEGYLWEDSPIALKVPLYHAKYVHMFLSPRMGDAWEVPLKVEGETQMCKMVPHGCTNLRITYLPRADV